MDIIDYNSSRVWEKIKKNNIQLIKNKYFSFEKNIPMYETPPNRNDILYFKKRFEIIDIDKKHIFLL